jgi:hypothetical protein
MSYYLKMAIEIFVFIILSLGVQLGADKELFGSHPNLGRFARFVVFVIFATYVELVRFGYC